MDKDNKKNTSFRKCGLNLTIDENLNKLKGIPDNSEKVAEANRRVRKIKSLPK